MLAEFGYVQCADQLDVCEEEVGGFGGGREAVDRDGREGVHAPEVDFQSGSGWAFVDGEPGFRERDIEVAEQMRTPSPSIQIVRIVTLRNEAPKALLCLKFENSTI